MITDNDILDAVGQNAYAAGLSYYRRGRVELVREVQRQPRITARVMGRAGAYRQSIKLALGKTNETFISGECSCPIGLNCKHVAAALFHYVTEIQGETQVQSLIQGNRPAPSGSVQAQTLPSEVDAWLRSLDAAQEQESEDYPPKVRRRLLYVLSQAPGAPRIAVDLRSIEYLANGTISPHVRDLNVQQLHRAGQAMKFLRPSDRAIIRHLDKRALYGPDLDFTATLEAIVATGRGRWARWDAPALARGDPVPGTLAWDVDEDSRQRMAVQLPPGLIPLRLSPLWYVDPASGMVGPIETGMPDRMVHTMLASPPLLPEVALRVRDELARRFPQRALPAPEPIAPPERTGGPARVVLHLLLGTLPFDPARPSAPHTYSMIEHRLPLARLSFQYGPVLVGHQERRDIIRQDGHRWRVVRDYAFERDALRRLHEFGFQSISHFLVRQDHAHAHDLVMQGDDPGSWITFMLDDVPDLRDEGWQVELAEDFPVRLVKPEGPFSVEIHEASDGSGIDWFDFDVGVMVDGVRINLVPALLELLGNPNHPAGGTHDAHDVLIPLPDGRLLAVPYAQLQPILGPLLELFGDFYSSGNTHRLSRQNAADIAALEDATAGSGIVWTGGDAVRTLGRQLRDHDGIPPCPAPEGFTATLRPYQAHGLAWLQFLRTAGMGGVLADDMGLGKTVQALAHVAAEQAAGRLDHPALIVCPTSLVPNWRAEAARFAPSLRVLVLHGPGRAALFGAIPGHDIVITTYPLLARDHAVLVAQPWHMVVLDEAQTIKNPLAATSKLARTLQAGQRLCLSGTPLENHLGELWSLYDFLMPGFLGDRVSFGRRFRTPIEKAGNEERRAQLARRIAPFLLRRTKEEVAPELPPKTEITETIEMADAQRALYEGIRLSMHAKVRAAIAKRGMAGSGIIILDALLKLRQACCDPRLLKLTTVKASKARSAKLERLLEMLPQMLEEGRRVLLFSQFTSMLALIQAELDALGLPYELLTGDTKDRAGPVQQFQTGAANLFLISLKAGGTGLNLTAADTVIHYDPWWNPAVENQATDRAHRIGQDKSVFVHRLITEGSIEEKMEILKERKRALAAGILGASSGTAAGLTEGDLDILFAPLGG